jgi:hypothetical protein
MMMQQMMQGGMAPPGVGEPLATLRAGKMECKNSPTTAGKFLISPILDKGQIQLTKDEQGILKFQWKNRISDAIDPTCDHMVFPGDASFKKVNTGRENDRVVLLQFTSNASRRFFFWLQDKNEDKDEELITKFNDILDGRGGNDEPPPLVEAPAEQQNQPVQMADLLRVLGLPAAAPAPNAEPTSSSAPVQPPASGAGIIPAASQTGNTPLSSEDLARAMAGIGQARTPPTALQDIVNADDITSSAILSDQNVQQELLSTLPEGHQTEEELVATLHSPQFQQTLTSLSSALQSDSYGSILANFSLDAAAGAEHLNRGDNVGAFLASVQDQANRSRSNSSAEDSKNESSEMSDDKPEGDGESKSN